MSSNIPYSFSRIRNKLLTLAAGTAVRAASDDVISHVRLGRNAVAIYNAGDAAIYYGDADVTADTGMPIAAGETIIFPVSMVDSENSVYVVSAAAATVRIAEFFD